MVAVMSQAPASQFVESDDEFFELTGPLPTAWDDHRRFPRFYYRSCAEAIIHPLRSNKNATRCQCFLLTRDLSRGGLSIIHTEQLFPGQKLEVILNAESPRVVEVVWCRRWSHNRYAIGCRFLGSSDTAPAEASAPETKPVAAPA
jgi:hypothetical protein